ncbi:hypothetical protein L3Y34_010350 [Caenorhabditis briggsae]|uniref:Sdz-33 F-box domain-containing protein n=1 Tax=Caenorhabditis briggsae TaxID=6238 RepID=A0AAE8ZME6_CAEBR|nr:hypothetical protein L3Y34_010350 [Caenorhabditis briggsae]
MSFLDFEDLNMIPFTRILEHLTLTDMFLASFTNENAHNILEDLFVRTFISIQAFDGKFDLKVKSPGPRATLCFTTQKTICDLPEGERKMVLHIRGHKIEMTLMHGLNQKVKYIHVEKKYVPLMLTVVFDYIRDLFGTTDFNICVSLNKMRRYLRDMDVLCMTIVDKKISAGSLERLLTRIRVHEHLRLLAKVTGSLPENSAIHNISQLHTQGTWMKFKHIMRFNGEHALFDRNRFTEENIVDFIAHFLLGGFPNLQTVIMRSKNRLDYKKVTQHVASRPWDPTQRARHFMYTPEISSVMNDQHLRQLTDCTYGFDIVCGHGRLATFQITSNHFVFFVWTDPFPWRHMLVDHH